MEKLKSGWTTERVLFSEKARTIFDAAIDHRRLFVLLAENTMRGWRFNDNEAILARVESQCGETEFLECPGLYIGRALTDAAQADYWYAMEKRYDDYEYYGELDGTEIIDEE